MTVDDLAIAAGIAKGVYLHCTSKEEIALARIDRVIDELLARLEAVASSHRPAAQRLHEMLVMLRSKPLVAGGGFEPPTFGL